MVKMVPPAYPGLAPGSAKSYSPPEDKVFKWHTVTPNKESLDSIAKQYGVPVEKLIEFNFPGSVRAGRVNPDIVNWYLCNHKRTRCMRIIGYNYVFTGGEKIAIPYLGSVEIGPIVLHPPTGIRKVAVLTSNEVVQDKSKLAATVSSLAKGVWQDFILTNEATGGKAAKFGAGIPVGGAVANYYEVYTPLKWALKGFGALPIEFTKSGAIQVFEFTTLERALLVAKAAAVKFVLVLVAYEGGVLIGSVINQALVPESTKDAIGGTINEIVNEGGWKLLFTHPFGIGM